MLQVNQLTKSFSGIPVLRDITLNVDVGSIIGLAGPSGCGKSTLLRCLQGLEKIDSGKIEGNQKSGFMFQDFQLFPHMSVVQNLVYAAALRDRSIDFGKRAVELLNNLGLGDKRDVYPHQLSGGQKQRVALARMLMMNPNVLFCDEPTSGLDVATVEDVVTLLKSVNVTGVTMIIASHDLDFLTKIADKIIVLKAGQIVADVETEEVYDPVSLLRSLYN